MIWSENIIFEINEVFYKPVSNLSLIRQLLFELCYFKDLQEFTKRPEFWRFLVP